MTIIWLRRFIRRNFKHIDPDIALKYKQRLSVMYAFFSMNLFLLVVYKTTMGRAELENYTNTHDEELSPAAYWAKKMGVKNAMVYRISGTDVSSYKITDNKTTSKNAEDDSDIL